MMKKEEKKIWEKIIFALFGWESKEKGNLVELRCFLSGSTKIQSPRIGEKSGKKMETQKSLAFWSKIFVQQHSTFLFWFFFFFFFHSIFTSHVFWFFFFYFFFSSFSFFFHFCHFMLLLHQFFLDNQIIRFFLYLFWGFFFFFFFFFFKEVSIHTQF